MYGDNGRKYTKDISQNRSWYDVRGEPGGYLAIDHRQQHYARRLALAQTTAEILEYPPCSLPCKAHPELRILRKLPTPV